MQKNYKVIDSTKGWRTGEVGLIIDFTNSKLRHLQKDTLINIKVNKYLKKISFKNDADTIKYTFKDSLLEFKDDNIINIFQPFKFKKELNFSKEKVLKLLTKNRIKPIENSLRINFRNYKIKDHINPKAKILQVQKVNGDLFLSFWFLEKINNNLILGFYTEYEPNEINYYRILKITNKLIQVEPLIEYPLKPKLRFLEFEEY